MGVRYVSWALLFSPLLPTNHQNPNHSECPALAGYVLIDFSGARLTIITITSVWNRQYHRRGRPSEIWCWTTIDQSGASSFLVECAWQLLVVIISQNGLFHFNLYPLPHVFSSRLKRSRWTFSNFSFVWFFVFKCIFPFPIQDPPNIGQILNLKKQDHRRRVDLNYHSDSKLYRNLNKGRT